MTENLFSYGTFQKLGVQLGMFHRELAGETDFISGYKLSLLEITNADAIAASGETHHPIIKYTGVSTDVVKGTVFKISHDELKDADKFEVNAYKRISISLKSGGKAWVYVQA